jgi:RNA polymerase sigma-70 factor (sigma-E family)
VIDLSKRLSGVGRHTDDEFTGFVHETASRLHRTAVLLTADHHLAEDLVQSTYARLYANWRRVRGADNPVGYALATLTNVHLSHRRLRRSSEIPIDVSADPTLANARHHESPDIALDVLAALRELSPTDRTILVLRYWEDRSVTQTAGALGISETAVRARTKRAADRLRVRLADHQTHS